MEATSSQHILAGREETASRWGYNNASLQNYVAFAFILAFTCLVRLPEFGNPAPDFDEQLYYLAGERMWQGALPFVDIWDRKPFGLFLIYAVAHVFGDQGIMQYQLLAAAFAAATAWLIFLIARRITNNVGSLCAAALYVVYLRALLSAVGQAETFFMLFCVAAMYLAIKAIETDRLSRVRNYACISMLLLGIGLQIKYTIVFQCVFFGAFFLWRIFCLNRNMLSLAMSAAVFVAIGLGPTVLVTGYYVSIGQIDAFVYANFLSVFERGALTGQIARYCIVYSLTVLAPLAAIAVYQVAQPMGSLCNARAIVYLLLAWAVSGIAAVFLTSSVYVYYFIPLVPALAILTGVFIGNRSQRWAVMPALLIYAGYFSGYVDAFEKSRNDSSAISDLTALLKQYSRDECIYVYDGPTILYSTTRSCLPTTRPYPDHLSNFQEKHSIGIDQTGEIDRVLKTNPAAIVTANRPVVPKLSPEPLAMVTNIIKQQYRLAGREFYDRRIINVYVRNDLLPQAVAAGAK